jgi:transposase
MQRHRKLEPVPIAQVAARLIDRGSEDRIMAERFWLSDTQLMAIEPLLPRLGGEPRVDDRRITSGVLPRFRERLRWRAVPADYGPRTTLFNRLNRWSEKGSGRRCWSRSPACRSRAPSSRAAGPAGVFLHLQ